MSVVAEPASSAQPAMQPPQPQGVRVEPAYVRGPLRPPALTPVRSRVNGSMLRVGFRVVDALALGLGAAASLELSASGTGAIWPAAAGALLTFMALPATGAYVFAKTETYAMAMLRGLAAVAAVAMAMALVQTVAEGAAGLGSALRWTVTTLVALD